MLEHAQVFFIQWRCSCNNCQNREFSSYRHGFTLAVGIKMEAVGQTTIKDYQPIINELVYSR